MKRSHANFSIGRKVVGTKKAVALRMSGVGNHLLNYENSV